jgi:hypothetical protein
LVDGGVASHFVVFSRGTLLGGVVGVGEVAVGLDSGVLDVNHYAFVDWNNSLVGWWRFEESSWSGVDGEVVDESGNNNHGKAFGGASTIANGKFGRGGSFDGVGGTYISTGLISPSLNTNVVSISFWAKVNNNGVILGTDYRNFEIRIGPISFSGYVGDDGENTWVMISGINHDVNSEEWNHYTYIFDYSENEVILYANGGYKGTFTSTDDFIYNRPNDILEIGRRRNGSGEFNGFIDEVLIFNRALSADEVKSLYNATVNQYQNNFTNLTGGDYSFRGYAVDVSGNKYETELREFVCVE